MENKVLYIKILDCTEYDNNWRRYSFVSLDKYEPGRGVFGHTSLGALSIGGSYLVSGDDTDQKYLRRGHRWSIKATNVSEQLDMDMDMQMSLLAECDGIGDVSLATIAQYCTLMNVSIFDIGFNGIPANILTPAKRELIRDFVLSCEWENYLPETHMARIGLPSEYIHYLMINKTAEQRTAIVDAILLSPFAHLAPWYGYGLAAAEKVAAINKIDGDNKDRACAYVFHSMEELDVLGNSYVVDGYIQSYVQHSLAVNELQALSKSYLDSAVIQLIEDEKLVVDEQARLFLYDNYHAEQYIASDLAARMAVERVIAPDSLIREQAIRLADEYNMELSESQLCAVVRAVKSEGGVLLVDGGAGTGKTTVLQWILYLTGFMARMFNEEGADMPTYDLLAFTGKAADVLEAKTKAPTSTIQRRIGMDAENMRRNLIDRWEITSNITVIDEGSMVSARMLAGVLKAAVDPKTKIILVGDSEQLAPINVGKPFKDLLDAGVYPHVNLDVSYRVSSNSELYGVANGVREQFSLDIPSGARSVRIKPDLNIVPQVVEDYFDWIDAGHSVESIQVLSPVNADQFGQKHINKLIQERLFKGKPVNKIEFGYKSADGTRAHVFYVGDKVIHIVNDYNIPQYKRDGDGYSPLILDGEFSCGVMNGSIGRVVDIRKEIILEEEINYLVVEYKDHTFGHIYVKYTTKEMMNALRLAYAITIAKSQGDQWPKVLLLFPAHKGVYGKWGTRNTLYTGMTRTEHDLTIYGNLANIQEALQYSAINQRKTLLTEKAIAAFEEMLQREGVHGNSYAASRIQSG